MELKQRLQLFIFIVILLSIALSGMGIGIVMYNKILTSESELMLKDLKRTREFFHNEVENLSINIRDWSIWDDTYRYMQDGNKEYIKSNLSSSSVTSLQISAMIFINLDGSINNSTFINTDNNAHMVELSLINMEFNKIYDTNKESTLQNGIMRIRDKNYIYAINGIQNSAGTSEINGYLLMLRLIDDNFNKRLAVMLDHKVELESISLEDLVSTKDTVINDVTFTDKTLTGYVIISDNIGNPVLKVNVIHDRFLLEQGNSVVYLTLAVLGLVSIVSGGSYYWFMKKDIVENLNGISEYIKTIISKEPITQSHPKLTGEFAKLASVLTQISSDLLRNERELETKNLLLSNANKNLEMKQAELEKSNADLHEMNSAMVGRETKMIELKKEIENLKAQLGQS